MRGKTKAYLALSMLGLLFAALAAFWLADSLTRAQTGLAVGIGTSMFGFGVAKFLVGHWEEKRPEALRANEIEAKDERNRMIRERAGAVSGSVLQWAVLAVAWVAILLEAPVWVPIACAAVFVGKVILEFCLAAYFNRRM